CDQFRRARAGRNRIDRAVMIVVIVMAVIRSMGMIVMMMVGVTIAAAHRQKLGPARAVAADQRDRTSENGAEKRKEDNRVIHGGALALHHVEVLNRDRAAVSVEDDEDRETDGGLGRGDGQHEQ